MKKDYQVRVEFESDGAEEVYNFGFRPEAERAFRSTCDKLANERHDDDVHVELIEVLEQERIEPEFNTSDDIDRSEIIG